MKITKILEFVPALGWFVRKVPLLKYPVCVQYFRDYPEHCFRSYQSSNTYSWPEAKTLHVLGNLEDIYLYSLGIPIGYIQGITVDLKRKTATVTHFATASQITRRGVGSQMARELGQRLKSKYGIKTLIFSERKMRQQDAAFFASLGAKPVAKYSGMDSNYKVPDWHWKIP